MDELITGGVDFLPGDARWILELREDACGRAHHWGEERGHPGR